MVHEWMVIGGGPVGALAVGVLLKRGVRAIHWIDPCFERLGRLGERYASVPANTRNDRLVSMFQSLPALNFEASQTRLRHSGTGRVLLDGDPMSTMPLQASIDALRQGSNAIRQDARVAAHRGLAVRLCGDQEAARGVQWRADVALADDHGCLRRPSSSTKTLLAERVILSPGALPRLPPSRLVTALTSHGVRLLAHDDAVVPALLSSLVQSNPTLRGARFAIVGGSHSGMLAARNALDLCAAASVEIFSRGPLRLAEEREGWIKFDGTGLKGDVRAWAVDQLSKGRRPSDQGSCVRVHTDAPCSGDDAQDIDELARRVIASRADWLIWATGFERRAWTDAPTSGAAASEAPLPRTSWSGRHVDLVRATYDGQTGAINGAHGLHGVGIAFPEVYTDIEGHTEPRVGFVSSFVAHCNRIVDSAS